jgi:hypothetical protein
MARELLVNPNAQVLDFRVLGWPLSAKYYNKCCRFMSPLPYKYSFALKGVNCDSSVIKPYIKWRNICFKCFKAKQGDLEPVWTAVSSANCDKKVEVSSGLGMSDMYKANKMRDSSASNGTPIASSFKDELAFPTLSTKENLIPSR